MNVPRAACCLGAAVAALTLAGCGRAPDPLAGCTLPAEATVLAIGDSITRGHGADGQGYSEQLQRLLAAEPGRAGVRVLNLGRDGERSAELAARLGEALQTHRPAVVLITSGGNDFLRRVPPQQTGASLRTVVAAVRAAGATPVLFAVPQPSLAAAMGLLSDHPLYAELAEEGHVAVIGDVVAEVLSEPGLSADRIHPNADGYARMAAAARQALARCR